MLFQEGSNEFLRRSFWTEVFAEFLVTLIYLFLVCGAVLPWNNTPPPVIHGAFISGLSIATLVMAVMHISGGHLNPVVTISFMSVGRVSVLKAIFFIVAQCLGAICGAAMVYGTTPQEVIGSLGVTAPGKGVTTMQAFAVELGLTFVLMFFVMAVTDPTRGMTGYGVPLSIGICVFVCLMQGIPSSGASLNPARSIGPAVVMNSWRDHWIYWAAPTAGGLLGTGTYQLVFASKRSNHDSDNNMINSMEVMDKDDASKFLDSTL